VKYNLIVTTVAEEQIMNACNYYETQQPSLSERLLAELKAVYKKYLLIPNFTVTSLLIQRTNSGI